MARKKTKEMYEEYLNQNSALFHDCLYLCNPSRGKSLKEGSLRNLLYDHRYGYVMRKYDPIAFEVGYKEWKNK